MVVGKPYFHVRNVSWNNQPLKKSANDFPLTLRSAPARSSLPALACLVEKQVFSLATKKSIGGKKNGGTSLKYVVFEGWLWLDVWTTYGDRRMETYIYNFCMFSSHIRKKKTLCGGGMWRVSYPGKAQLKNPTFQPVTTAAILWELQVSTEVDKQRAPGDSIWPIDPAVGGHQQPLISDRLTS